MPDIRHRVGIAAPAGQVYDAFATIDGLSTWWTTTVKGDPSVGGELCFFFGGDDPAGVMRVDELTPPTRVMWRCVRGPDEWVGTNLVFDVKEQDGQSVILFTHANWREPVEFMHHCSTKWAYFLLGLKSGFEGGKATPYPYDTKIDNWG
jgi:uncharacterized protein YndB with AHSA1/START domain